MKKIFLCTTLIAVVFSSCVNFTPNRLISQLAVSKTPTSSPQPTGTPAKIPTLSQMPTQTSEAEIAKFVLLDLGISFEKTELNGRLFKQPFKENNKWVIEGWGNTTVFKNFEKDGEFVSFEISGIGGTSRLVAPVGTLFEMSFYNSDNTMFISRIIFAPSIGPIGEFVNPNLNLNTTYEGNYYPCSIYPIDIFGDSSRGRGVVSMVPSDKPNWCRECIGFACETNEQLCGGGCSYKTRYTLPGDPTVYDWTDECPTVIIEKK